MPYVGPNRRIYIETGFRERKQLSRVVMEEHLGRPLSSNEHVHHKDGDPSNNELDNLEVLNVVEHRALHGPCHTTPHSEETKEAIRKANRGNHHALGHKLSEETKEVIGYKTSRALRAYWARMTLQEKEEYCKARVAKRSQKGV